MFENITLRESLSLFEQLEVPVSKIASGYYIGQTETYILCRCEGNSRVVSGKCECGQEFFMCEECHKERRILECPACLSEFNKEWREFEKNIEEFSRKLYEKTKDLSDEELNDLFKKDDSEEE